MEQKNPKQEGGAQAEESPENTSENKHGARQLKKPPRHPQVPRKRPKEKRMPLYPLKQQKREKEECSHHQNPKVIQARFLV